jgi:N-methylhydantoinase A
MARGIRVMTVERGLDPRGFALVAFGGAGPLHAAEIAVELEIPEVVVPEHPGVTSAQGLMFGDVVHDYAVSLVRPVAQLDFDEVTGAFKVLEERGRAALRADGLDETTHRLERLVDLRYLGQVKALSMRVGGNHLDEVVVADVTRSFFVEYERQYQYVTSEIPLELAAVRLKAVGRLDRPTMRASTRPESGARRAMREVFFDGERLATQVISRASLARGDRVDGPALVEQTDTTTVIPPGCSVRIDSAQNLIINVAERLRPHRGRVN